MASEPREPLRAVVKEAIVLILRHTHGIPTEEDERDHLDEPPVERLLLAVGLGQHEARLERWRFASDVRSGRLTHYESLTSVASTKRASRCAAARCSSAAPLASFECVTTTTARASW